MDRDFCQALVALALQKGAQAADAYAVSTHGISAEIFGGEVEEFSRNNSRGAGLRVLINNRIGYAYTEAFDRPEITVRSALSNAQVTDPEPDADIYHGPAGYAALSPAEDLPADKAVVDAAMALYEQIMAIPDAHSTQGCSAQANITRIQFCNSAGITAQHSRSGALLLAMPVAKRGDWTDSGWAFAVGKNLGGLSPAPVAAEAMERALGFYDEIGRAHV